MKDDKFEYETRSVIIDANMGTEVEKLTKEGWEMATPPVAVYWLKRALVEQPAVTAEGKMVIDESKVFVMPARRPNGLLQN